MKSRNLLAPFFVLALLSLGGCAPLAPNYSYQGFGAADPHRDRSVVDKIESTKTTPTSNEVVVLLDTIPEGLRVNQGVLHVEDGWHHEVLGKVEVSPNGHASFISLLGFPQYEDGGHKVACYPQTVLTYATLTLWAFISPTAYPCWGRVGLDDETVIDSLRKAGAAAGGNLVVASVLRINDKIYMAHGMVLRADPRLRAKTAPAPSDPAPGTQL